MQKTTLGPYEAYLYPNVLDPVTKQVTDRGFVAVMVPSSKSDKFGDPIEYTVIVNFTGTYECDCPGFVYRSACKHVTAIKSIVEAK